MSRITRRDEFGTFAPLQPPTRRQPNYRELSEMRAELDSPPIEAEPKEPEPDKAATRDAWIVLGLAAAYLAGRLLHWLILQ